MSTIGMIYAHVLGRYIERLGRVPVPYEPMPVIVRTERGTYVLAWQTGIDKQLYRSRRGALDAHTTDNARCGAAEECE